VRLEIRRTINNALSLITATHLNLKTPDLQKKKTRKALNSYFFHTFKSLEFDN